MKATPLPSDCAMAGAAAVPIPLPGGMEPAPEAALDIVVGPLPFNFKENPLGGFDKYGYSHTAVAKDWRSPTEKLLTVVERPSSDNLFDFASILSKEPGELLNPPPLTKEEKKAKATADKAERERRAELDDDARDKEDAEKKDEKFQQARALSRRGLAMRIGRKAFNYGTSHKSSTPSEIPEEHLTTINDYIAKVLPDDDIKLTSDQAVTWLCHAVPLSPDTLKFFSSSSRFSAYQSIAKDICELLLVDELVDGRFNQLVCWLFGWRAPLAPRHTPCVSLSLSSLTLARAGAPRTRSSLASVCLLRTTVSVCLPAG